MSQELPPQSQVGKVVPPPVVGNDYKAVISRQNVPRKSFFGTIELLKIIAGGVAGLIIGYLLICRISPRNDFLNLFAKATAAIEESLPLTPAVDEKVAAQTSEPPADKTVLSEPDTQVPSVPVVPKSEPPEKPPSVEVSESIAEKQSRLEEQRDAAASKDDLAGALNVVEELSKLNDTNSLEAKLSFLSTLDAETAPLRRIVVSEMLKLLDRAVAEKQFDLTAKHLDRLLISARILDDLELERRATLIALKRPSEPILGPKSEGLNTEASSKSEIGRAIPSTNDGTTVDEKRSTIITNLGTFKSHWKNGDNRGNFWYDDKANAIVIDSPYDLGTLSDSEPWTEFYFEIAAKSLSFDDFDIQINGVTFKLGSAVQRFPSGTPVRVVFDKENSQAKAFVGSDRVSQATILNDKWTTTFQCNFSSGGGQNAQIRLFNIQLRRPIVK